MLRKECDNEKDKNTNIHAKIHIQNLKDDIFNVIENYFPNNDSLNEDENKNKKLIKLKEEMEKNINEKSGYLKTYSHLDEKMVQTLKKQNPYTYKNDIKIKLENESIENKIYGNSQFQL